METIKTAPSGASVNAEDYREIKEICGYVEEQVRAFDWYLCNLALEMKTANINKAILPKVHIALLYQQSEAMFAMLDVIKGYLPEEVAK